MGKSLPIVELEPIVMDGAFAIGFLWNIMKERSELNESHTNISHSDLPSRREHVEFVQTHPFRHWFLIRNDDYWAVGQIRLTWRNEIGVSLLRKFRGKGYGRAAVQKLMETVTPMPAVKSHTREGFIANINPDNEKSIKMFTDLGFRHIQNTYMLDG